jgi:hypothetical protein
MLRVVTPSIGPSMEITAIVSAFRPAGIVVGLAAGVVWGGRCIAPPRSKRAVAMTMIEREIFQVDFGRFGCVPEIGIGLMIGHGPIWA